MNPLVRFVDGRPELEPQSVRPALTAAQQQALQIHGELAVGAGAGAGKTAILSLRFALLMLDEAWRAAQEGRDPDIECALVLTFTDKAATEMAERCERRLWAVAEATSTAAASSADRRVAANVASLHARMDRARISTFHAFCARVLREHPVETGTPPGFAVKDGPEGLRERSVAIEGTLARWAADPVRKHELRAVLDAIGGRARLVEALGQLVDGRDRVGAALEAAALGHLPLPGRGSAPEDDAIRLFLQTEARRHLGDLRAVLSAGPPDSKKAPITAARAALDALPDEPLALHALYRATLQSVLPLDEERVRTLEHHTVLGKKDGWDRRAFDFAKRALQALAPAFNGWAERFEAARSLASEADVRMVAAATPLAKLALDAIGTLSASLDAQAALDFTELQNRAVAAVAREAALRDRLQERFRHVMVDEFQDTDERQWSMVRAIASRADREGSLFVVGDKKQAIYGFRGGDVSVYAAATEQIAEQGRSVRLAHNFRSTPALIAWFNEVFPAILPGAADAPYEAEYEPLEAGRPHPPEGSGVPRPAVALFVQPKRSSPLIEAEALADHVATLLPDLEARPTPSVAVLLRARTRQGLFEDALRRRGIAFVVPSGIGFFGRPEVIDLVNALDVLARADRVALVGVLRSPLFAVPDLELERAWMARGGLDPDDATPLGIPSVDRALSILADLRAQRDLLRPSALLRTLCDRALAEHAWALSPDPDRAAGNARLLIERVAALDADAAQNGIELVADWLSARVDDADREGEIALAPGAAQVAILTVHASKGLEFPVVLVPQLGSGARGPVSALTIQRPVHGQFTFAFTPHDPAGPLDTPGAEAALAAIRDAEGDAESRRLFYVACTRAEDHLALFATDTAAEGTWLAALRRHEPTARGIELALGGQPSRVGELSVGPCGPDAGDRDAGPLFDVPRTESLPEPIRSPAAAAVPDPPLQPLASHHLPIDVTASSLDRFGACPAWWLLRDHLRLDPWPEPADDTTLADAPPEPIDARAVARAVGDVLHGLIEDDRLADEPLALARLKGALAGRPASWLAAATTSLIPRVRRSARDPAVIRSLRSPGRSEVAFRANRGRVVLHGQIDRLWADRDGLVVTDWKSGRTAAEAHRRQILAYAWAADQLSAADGAHVVRGELFLAASSTLVEIAYDAAAKAEIEALLDAIEATADRPVAAVEADVIASPTPRPCDRCGFRGRGCAGKPIDQTAC